MLKPTTDATFASDIQGELPVLVDFWGHGCAPCERLMPLLETLAEKTEGLAKLYKLNVQENPQTAAEFGIRGVPTVIVFENGKETERFTGIQHPLKYIEALGLESE